MLSAMPEPISTDIEVTEFAGQLFFRLWRASHTRSAEALGSIGLTTALFGVLNVLGGRDATIQQSARSGTGAARRSGASRGGKAGAHRVPEPSCVPEPSAARGVCALPGQPAARFYVGSCILGHGYGFERPREHRFAAGVGG